MRYLEELKELNLSPDQYAVFGSGPLAIRGIRPNEDIDILVTDELWQRLEGEYRADEKGMLQLTEHIETSNSISYLDDVDACIKDADIIDGIRYVRLVHIMEWKNKKGRDKDKKDVKLILDYLRTSDEQL